MIVIYITTMKLLTKYVLSEFGGKVATRSEINETCRKFRANPKNTINYMIHYGFFIRILRGLYYVKNAEEFTLGKAVDVYKAISSGMNKLKNNWYFGLYTSLRLNGLTHEFFGTIFVLNSQIFRPKEITIAGEKVKFIKLKDKLFGFGTIERNGVIFSDPEKTTLDFIYIFRYRGVGEERIISIIEDYSKDLKKNNLKAYLRFYPKSVWRVAEYAKLI
jgi:predicted transcriptional regulator of viral defense system